MAVIKSERVPFDGAMYELKINCDAKGVFYINLPPKLSESLGVPARLTASTLIEIQNKWNDLVGQFNGKKTSNRKVIIYKMEIEADFEIGDEHIQIRDWVEERGESLKLQVAVYNEEKIELDRRVVRNYHYMPSSIPTGVRLENERWLGRNDDVMVIDWTPEREKFFADLVLAFERVLYGLSKVMGDKKKLVKFIDSGQKLLLGGEPDEDLVQKGGA